MPCRCLNHSKLPLSASWVKVMVVLVENTYSVLAESTQALTESTGAHLTWEELPGES